jgi:DNA-binding SARP family transcriptional activator/CheY-like chemotaxis protein
MSPCNILVVEDRDDWQTILSTALQREGYTPFATTSYAKALAMLDTHSYALAVIDPVLDVHNRFNRDGLSVIQTIRSRQPAMPLVIVTGSLTRDMQSSLQHLGLDVPVMLKESWDPLSFTTLVRSLVGAHHQSDPTTPPHPGCETVTLEVCPLPPTVETCPPGCPRVLVVENRPDWQAIVTRVLDSAGYFWRVAATAQEAVRELEQESFHLILLDLKLQSNDLPITSSEGWLLLDYLVESRPTSKVAILSGKACPGDVATLLTRYPVITFLEKQRFTPQDILDAVDQATRAPALRIQTLGPFRIWRDNQAIVVWERPQAETVVKILLARLAQNGRTVPADQLITYLWPDADEESGRKKLLPLISNARHMLEPDIEPRDSHFIVRNSNGYCFDMGSSVQWDLLSLREHIRLGQLLAQQGRREEAVAELEKARALYQGDFMTEDCYAEWVGTLRRSIVNEFCEGLLILADSYTALQNYAGAIAACELILHKDPLQERVYRRLMCLHAANNDKGQALKVYRDCLKVFEELFGESPTPVTQALYDAIANDEPIVCETEY